MSNIVGLLGAVLVIAGLATAAALLAGPVAAVPVAMILTGGLLLTVARAIHLNIEAAEDELGERRRKAA